MKQDEESFSSFSLISLARIKISKEQKKKQQAQSEMSKNLCKLKIFFLAFSTTVRVEPAERNISAKMPTLKKCFPSTCSRRMPWMFRIITVHVDPIRFQLSELKNELETLTRLTFKCRPQSSSKLLEASRQANPSQINKQQHERALEMKRGETCRKHKISSAIISKQLSECVNSLSTKKRRCIEIQASVIKSISQMKYLFCMQC